MAEYLVVIGLALLAVGYLSVGLLLLADARKGIRNGELEPLPFVALLFILFGWPLIGAGVLYATTVVEGARRAFVYQDDNRSELYIVVEHVERGGPDITAVVSQPLATVVTLFDLGQYPQLEVFDAA